MRVANELSTTLVAAFICAHSATGCGPLLDLAGSSSSHMPPLPTGSSVPSADFISHLKKAQLSPSDSSLSKSEAGDVKTGDPFIMLGPG
jgi:hypothetical protein